MSKKRRGRSKVNKHNRFAFIRAADSEIYSEWLFIDRGQFLFNRPIFCSESVAATFVRDLNAATTAEERQDILGRWITDVADRFGESQRTGQPDIKRKEIEMHDKNGKPLKVGDTILLVAVITATSAVDDYCNVTAKIGGDAEHGPNNIVSTVSLNAKQVELVEPVETAEAAADEAVHETAEPATSADLTESEPEAVPATESSTEASSEEAEPNLADSNADVRAAAAEDGEEPGEQPFASSEPASDPAPVGSQDDPQRQVDAEAPTPSADAASNAGGNF